MLTAAQIDLIRISFDQLIEQGDATTTGFYDRMFELEPRLRFLFPHDIAETKQRVMTMIGYVVRNLDRWENVEPRLLNLGRRHHTYGVRERDYTVFGEAVLDVLACRLNVGRDSDLATAWAELYNRVAGTMIEAAHDEEAPSPVLSEC